MKKILVLTLALMMTLSLFACGSSDTPAKETKADPVETEEKAPAENKAEEPAADTEEVETEEPAVDDLTFGLNETAVFEDLKFTALELQESDGEEFFTPEEGNKFVGIKFEIENVSDEEQSVSTLLQFEGYVNDIKVDYSFNAACVFDEGSLDGSVAPGKKLVGWYSLEVPADWTSIELNIVADWITGEPAVFVFEK